jgi:hypothetical protein
MGNGEGFAGLLVGVMLGGVPCRVREDGRPVRPGEVAGELIADGWVPLTPTPEKK